MRKTTLIVLTLTLCILNSGCDSKPIATEVNDPVVSNSPSAVNSPSIPEPEMSAEEQYQLGIKYYNGDGVFQDYTEAAKWYRLAAEQGLCVLGGLVTALAENQ